MSRDAKFMEDIIESGRCVRQNSRIVVYDADELVDDDSPQLVETDHENEEEELSEEMEPGSKRHQKTQSLEKAVTI